MKKEPTEEQKQELIKLATKVADEYLAKLEQQVKDKKNHKVINDQIRAELAGAGDRRDSLNRRILGAFGAKTGRSGT